MKRIRSVAIVVKDDNILLMYREKKRKQYWTIPGGGVEKNEKIEDAAIREVMEETCIKIEIERLLYSITYTDIKHKHYFYLAKYISGTPQLGNANELADVISKKQFYKPLWFPLKKLPQTLLYPLEVRDWIIEDSTSNFNKTRHKTMLAAESRERL